MADNEVEEVTLVKIIQDIVQRINTLECTLGYIIKTLNIPPPERKE